MDAMSGTESATRGTETPERGGMLLWMIFTGLSVFAAVLLAIRADPPDGRL